MNPHLMFLFFSVLAFVLFVAEVFLPGGIVGAVGAISLLVACGFAIVAFGPAFGTLVALLLILVTLGGFMFWLMKMPDTKLGKRFALQTDLQESKSAEDQDELVGHRGVAETHLHPSGYARIDGKRMDVVASRGFIDEGTPVEIVEVHGMRIVVREAEELPPAEEAQAEEPA